MNKIIEFRSISKDRRFESILTNVDITPLNVGDSITLPSKMSKTGWVKFQVIKKNVLLDTTQGQWKETTTLTGEFFVVNLE